jgi:hypothetical protein
MNKKHLLFLFIIIFSGIFRISAQNAKSEFAVKEDFDGSTISVLQEFVPSVADYTLEVTGKKGQKITIAFCNISYTPSQNGTIRFLQHNGKVSVFENGEFKVELTPDFLYTESKNNLIQNPGFEQVETELASGRWKPLVWDTWNGGMPTWGRENGYTNVREINKYRSEGNKSLLMDSNSRELYQQLPENALKPNSYYLLTYDYWTSPDDNKGGMKYTIQLRKGIYTNTFQTITTHTTRKGNNVKSTFSTSFRAPQEVSSVVYFMLKRNGAGIDWLDNFRLVEIIPSAKGISGITSANYLEGYVYAPMNIAEYNKFLDKKKKEVRQLIETIQSAPNQPGYNNLKKLQASLAYAESMKDNKIEIIKDAAAKLDNALKEYNEIRSAYNSLSRAIHTLEHQLTNISYPQNKSFETSLSKAREIYNSPKNNLSVIDSEVELLAEQSSILNTYAQFQDAIDNAEILNTTTQYSSKNVLLKAIEEAKKVISNPQNNNLNTTFVNLRNATNDYYNTQYAKPSEKRIVSNVDTSLEENERFVLRIEGKPFYMTNIQVRLDKLYGYEGWNDQELEAVLKQAANDGFNTVSIPVHWREVESEKDYFDWRILDKFMNWCKKYDLKMELLWFSWSSGGRVQYLWNYQGRKEPRTPDYVCSLDGHSAFNMLKKTWEYSLDWRDKNLLHRETFVMGKIMEHVAVWEANNGHPHTVVGVQLGNEAHENGNNTATPEEIIEYYHQVGSAVKESNHVVWTRLNCVSWMTRARLETNEKKRISGGTNIDFVGIDIYGTSAASIKGDMNSQLPQKGKNYAMIMEIDAKDSKSPIYQMAALAGDKAFDYYNMGFIDGNALYVKDPQSNKLVEGNRTHISLVRQRNKILNMANQDIAIKKHGFGLFVYNYAGDSTSKEKGIDGITFTPDHITTQAIVIHRSPKEIVLLSTMKGVFNLPANIEVVSASTGYFNENNQWVKKGNIDWNDRSIIMPETSCVLLTIK